MKCIICGKGSGRDIFCSSPCKWKSYKYGDVIKIRHLIYNLLQVRKQITKIYASESYSTANDLCTLEDTFYDMLESIIGLNKLADILKKDFDDTQETKEKADLCCI